MEKIKRNNKIFALRGNGESYREIAKIIGLSASRVFEIIHREIAGRHHNKTTSKFLAGKSKKYKLI